MKFPKRIFVLADTLAFPEEFTQKGAAAAAAEIFGKGETEAIAEYALVRKGTTKDKKVEWPKETKGD